MKPAPSSSRKNYRSYFLFIPGGVIAAVLMTGCGGGTPNMPPPLSGNTQVTLVLSSTANDELNQFGIGFASIALTSQSGKTVTLLSEPQGTQLTSEFIHVNGGANPLLTATVPQDVYATATIAVDDSWFACNTLTPGGALQTSIFAYGSNPDNAPDTTVTVTLAAPITIAGDSMALLLDLQVTPSVTYTSCYTTGITPYTIAPTFNLSPMVLASTPTNNTNGKVSGLQGQVTAIGASGSSFTLALPEGPRTLSISAGSGAVYQGIGDFSGLAVGTFVNMDGAIQLDGSVRAMRIAVFDPAAVDVQSGPVLIVGGDPRNPGTAAFVFNRQAQGPDLYPVTWPYYLSFAQFQVSGQFDNLGSLPFVPAFNVSNVVAGQNVSISAVQFQTAGEPYTVANTVTLVPQTINGTVLGSSTSGSFTDYTVSLAPYDLFPTLAVQDGQTTLLTNPSVVEVYVDSDTQRLNKQALTAGSTLRFYGLVFNDNGTLRMDCAQVNDGVTQVSAGDDGQSRLLQLKAGETREDHSTSFGTHGGMVHTTTTLRQR